MSSTFWGISTFRRYRWPLHIFRLWCDWMSVRNNEVRVCRTDLWFGSMYKASALYVMADDRLFSPFQER